MPRMYSATLGQASHRSHVTSVRETGDGIIEAACWRWSFGVVQTALTPVSIKLFCQGNGTGLAGSRGRVVMMAVSGGRRQG